jgi:DNA-binding NarL/FixJ family response regulator
MRVVIVDDDTFITGALKTILETTEEITVVGVGADGREALELYHEYKPDVLLMDIRMKEMSGLEAAEKILTQDTQAKILLLTTFSDDEYIIKALKAGVKGYLLKQDYQSILPALRAVCCGQSVFGTQIMEKLPELLMEKKQFDWLNREIGEKELQIISLVAEGLSNKEIAERLFLSEGTVRNYISSILDKLNLRDRTQLAVFYLNTK